MAESKKAADEVLAHSGDDEEWEEEPEQIESRPSGNQVISARLPTDLAEELLAEAARRGVRPSELVRQAVEALLHAHPSGVAGISADVIGMLRVAPPPGRYRTETLNPIVEIPTEPPEVIAVGL